MSELIEWQKADGSDGVSLAGASDYVGGFSPQIGQLVQIVQGVRAEHAKPINRRNVQTRLTFLVTLAPAASAADAREAVADLAVALAAASADHTLLEGVFGALTWQLADAALESFEPELIGVTIRARYVFVGGALTAA